MQADSAVRRNKVSTPSDETITTTIVRNACIVTNWASDSVATIVTRPITPTRNTILTQPAGLTFFCDSSSRKDRVSNRAASVTPTAAAATPRTTRAQLGSHVRASCCSLRSIAKIVTTASATRPTPRPIWRSLPAKDTVRPSSWFVAPPRETVDGGDHTGPAEHATKDVAAHSIGLMEHDQPGDPGRDADAEHRQRRVQRVAAHE